MSESPTTPATKLVFSGIQPSGILHLGNYLGAIKNWLAYQKQMPCIFCVVDLHAITQSYEPTELKNSTLQLAACLMATGINPNQHILFHQSGNPDHASLAWLFNTIAPIGWLNRMTQFKDKAGKNRENASTGLFTYPILMAADILLYRATHVPVGDDQKQHLELTRDLAEKFNREFCHGVNFFPLPEPIITNAPVARVMSLRDGNKKMSKSEPSDMSRINLTDSDDLIIEKIKKAKTDALPLPASETELLGRPEVANLLGIYAALKNSDVNKVLTEWSGKDFAKFKPALSELLIQELKPIRQKITEFMRQPEDLNKILLAGAVKAEKISKPILSEVKKIMGFL